MSWVQVCIVPQSSSSVVDVSRIDKVAKVIKNVINGSYRLSLVHQEFVDIVLSIFAHEIRSFKGIDKVVEDMVDVILEYQCFTSVYGIGKGYAASIIADIGQIERFKNHLQLAKYAGLS